MSLPVELVLLLAMAGKRRDFVEFVIAPVSHIILLCAGQKRMAMALQGWRYEESYPGIVAEYDGGEFQMPSYDLFAKSLQMLP